MSGSSGDLTIGVGFVPLDVSKSSFLGLIWGSLGVSFVFLLIRGYVRLTVFRRFFADDGMILLAWILIVISASIWQSMVDDLYLLYAITVGAIQPPANTLDIFARYSKRTVAVTMLNLFSLWSVKVSLLTLFYKLGQNVRGHKIIWWTAAVASFIGLAASIGVQNYKCIMGTPAEASAKCGTPAYGNFIYRSLRLQAAADVITDAFILAIPVKILWDVQISPRSKIGLVILFSLTIFTMIVAILKVTLTLRTTREDDSWLYMWGNVEPPVAIIIACGISYRALVSKEHKRSKYSGNTDQKQLRYGVSPGVSGARSAGAGGSEHHAGNDSQVHAGKASSLSDTSLGEEAVPLDVIHVRKDYDVIPESELGMAVQHREQGR
ncbi:MAG: hypothetical protein Q9220_007088 [cf. Caloplaca sp. 1 TL-2023]